MQDILFEYSMVSFDLMGDVTMRTNLIRLFSRTFYEFSLNPWTRMT